MRSAFLATLLIIASLGAGAATAFASEPADRLFTQDFYRPFHYRWAAINPQGHLVAAYLVEDYAHLISIFDVETQKHIFFELPIDGKKTTLASLAWIDDDSLAVTTTGHSTKLLSINNKKWKRNPVGALNEATYKPPLRTRVIDVVREESGIRLEDYEIATHGWIVHPLPQEEEQVLYAVSARKDAVHKLSLSSLRAPEGMTRSEAEKELNERERFTSSTGVAKMKDDVIYWYADRNGELVGAGTVDKKRRFSHWSRPSKDARWKRVIRTDPMEFGDIVPVGLSPSGQGLAVLSTQNRDTAALYEFDLEEQALGELLFEHPSADVGSVIHTAGSSEVAAAVFYEAGMRRTHYLTTEGESTRWLRKHFADKNVLITSKSADERKVVAFVESSNDPGAFYHFDLDRRKLINFGQSAPWLAQEKLAPVEAFRVQAEGGPEIEAFLALPRDQESKPPLVVSIHGGPIGFMDKRHYEPVVQQLANEGYAVLQVNYRGSAGYGKSFMEGGFRQWGKGIEDDIDAAIDHVVEAGLVDDKRMCIVGASYGGYSALISTVRNPERFRCAAAFAGVTDIALQFSTADFSQDQAFRKGFEQYVGDPVSEYEAMKDLSPVFLVEKIQVPVFIAHGELDSRVTVEHSMRLKAMLDLHDRSYEWMVLPGEGHSFSTLRAARSYYAKLMNFLADHLQDPFLEPVTGPTVFCGNKEQNRYKQRIYQSILKALHTDEMMTQPGSGVAGLSFWLNEEGGIRKRSVGRSEGKPVGAKLERAIDSLGPFGPPPGAASCWSKPVLQSFQVLGPDASSNL